MSTKQCIRCDERLPRDATRCHACNSTAPEDSVKMVKWALTTVTVGGTGLKLLFRFLAQL